MDVESGTVLEAFDPDGQFIPASVSKVPTTLYALETLGTDHRFVTRLCATGLLSGRGLDGDLVLSGSGDPTLDTDGLAALADQAVRAGVTDITGRLNIDASALPLLREIDPQQPEYVAYNPSISGLNVNYNRVFFQWDKAGGARELSLEARARRFSPEVTGISISAVPSQSPVFVWNWQAPKEIWTVSERALGKDGGRWLPVRNPVGYASDVFRHVAQVQGLTLPRGTPGVTAGAELGRWESDRLDTIIRDMLRYSTNITAEALGLTASRARGLAPQTLAESGAAMTAWLRDYAGLKGPVNFANHSGLTSDTRVSPLQMVTLLAAAERRTPGRLRGLMHDVPLQAGPREREIPFTGIAAAKTGTLNFVRGLAGYFEGPNGRRYAFAIFSAEMEARSKAANDSVETPPGSRPWIARSRYQERMLLRSWVARFAA
ncbi:D-alanyl-D-alanine carboxypeptidase/D-alanyl-D-alanine-endopeptidase [Paroceanicella profunda]|uniref:D-alanyl-D-alanine carboxypeptidase/D-alanyl-D-alanine-endopeptidase n=1 Tax=Paroceanicella profunda TaxID=2579971 RepID=A0A5B8G3P9_9RHOB|nr:D-alanyl-D-alanine carboxypeptidase/D-alanyl-D-alanine-endopeptidase [Paroceanicella profunda]QDL93423.1 D-alanyl-D-alanine carboxypeptidase/D-alanyl-D-alanine-endopeptidase [Paroceanicella profunda]